MKAACIASLLLLGGCCTTGTLGMHVATAHFNEAGKRMETSTPGLYLRRPDGLTVGAYSNSDGDPSAYAAWTWQTDAKYFAVTAGAAVGYRSAPITPLLAASARVPLTQRTAIRLALLPKPKHGAAGLHLAIEHDL